MPPRPGTIATDLFPVQIGWEDGYAFSRDTLGLGIEWNREAVQEHRVDTTGWRPLLRRDDGAFTNWYTCQRYTSRR